MNGKKLTEEHMHHLVTKGRTAIIKSFKKKDGSGTYDARLTISDEFKIKLEFDMQTSVTRPVAKKRN